MGSDLLKVIQQVGREKNINPEVLIEAVESALLLASKKRFGSTDNLAFHLNRETGEVELFSVRKVAEEIKDREKEILLEEARRFEAQAKTGDTIEVQMEIEDFGRIAAQTAKHVIIQKVREAERENVYNDFKDRKGELINGIILRHEKGNAIVDLGKTEVAIPPKEQIPGENFRTGDRIRAYIADVYKTTKGPQITLSRTHAGFVVKLFEVEVPEIYEGIVSIMAAVREPGERTKIAVHSKDKDVDPVGACVGVRGSRVQSIVRELRGEKIDIIRWSEDPLTFVANALSPAEILHADFDPKSKSVKIVVSDQHLSLAIGKRGQNARLASKLTGWKIDINSESEVKEQKMRLNKKREQVIKHLSNLPDMSIEVAERIINRGINSLEDVASLSVEELASISGVGEVMARNIIQSASEKLKRQDTGGDII
ncbi:MAG: transcription termination factor NusA [bacterium]